MVDLVALASPLWSRLATVALASALPAISMAQASGLAAPRSGTGGAANSASGQAAATPVAGAMQLKVRRLSDSVELVIEGAGMAPQLRQSGGATGWQGDLTVASPSGLRVGPQRLSIPELGFQTITFDGSGSNYRIGINPVAGAPLGRPVVSADGENLIISFPATAQVSLPVARFNARQPGAIPQPSYAPPLQPRAVAPPLGDMAVGTMTIRNLAYVNVSGAPVTMTLKNAPAKEALMALARLGGYGFAWVENPQPDIELSRTQLGPGGTAAGASRTETVIPGDKAAPVTIAFRGESYARAFNIVLLAAGLQAKKEGNTIFAGFNVLTKSFGSQLSKVYRLNQVGPNSAADFLANLGATVTKTNTVTTAISSGVSEATAVSGATSVQNTQSSTQTKVEAYGANTGPLIGLRATTDTRLSTITLFGDPSVVSIAEQYLRQLDLRQRQVALSVKILDVNLSNDTEIDNSFAFRFGNNFIVNDSGRLIGAFGRNLPPSEASFNRQSSGPLESIEQTSSSQSSSSLVIDRSRDLSFTRSQLRDINSELDSATGFKLASAGDQLVVTPIDSSSNILTQSTQRSIERIISRNIGRKVSTSRASGSAFDSSISGSLRPNPGSLYSDNSFFDFVQAQITSSNTRILASPTLILQEGNEPYGPDSDGTRLSADGKIGRSRTNEAFVRVGTQFVTAYDVKQDINGNNFCQPVFGNAGLTFGAKVDKIDDNGFVTFGLSPEISAPVGSQRVGNCGDITLISDRLLDTGKLRVRDGQTLILTGVISETDRTVVSKWPILGDIPLIGQFFRITGGEKTKNELVIMVTPRIIQDGEGGSYGYGYRPSTRYAQDVMNQIP